MTEDVSSDTSPGSNIATTENAVVARPIICRYFKSGCCRYGAYCRFVHDLEDGDVIRTFDHGIHNRVGACSRRTPGSCRNWINAPEFVPENFGTIVASDDIAEGTEGAVGMNPILIDKAYGVEHACNVNPNIDDTAVCMDGAVGMSSNLDDPIKSIDEAENVDGACAINPSDNAEHVDGACAINPNLDSIVEGIDGAFYMKSTLPSIVQGIDGAFYMNANLAYTAKGAYCANPNIGIDGENNGAQCTSGLAPKSQEMRSMMCPYDPPCPFYGRCGYGIHLERCEMCERFCLHPNDQTQRRTHNQYCVQQHEEAMELSFALARSKDKMCGICFDNVTQKPGREKRFGILPNCNHTFCLGCIRKWRNTKQLSPKITRACPVCRVVSDFVCPSAFWVDSTEDKEKLLTDYRKALGIKDCKYFKNGEGNCPFGNKCFYKHALPNGDLVDVGVPNKKNNKRKEGIYRAINMYISELNARGSDYSWLYAYPPLNYESDSDWDDD